MAILATSEWRALHKLKKISIEAGLILDEIEKHATLGIEAQANSLFRRWNALFAEDESVRHIFKKRSDSLIVKINEFRTALVENENDAHKLFEQASRNLLSNIAALTSHPSEIFGDLTVYRHCLNLFAGKQIGLPESVHGNLRGSGGRSLREVKKQLLSLSATGMMLTQDLQRLRAYSAAIHPASRNDRFSVLVSWARREEHKYLSTVLAQCPQLFKEGITSEEKEYWSSAQNRFIVGNRSDSRSEPIPIPGSPRRPHTSSDSSPPSLEPIS